MQYLLDTHAFLWATGKSQLLPRKITSVLRDPNNEVFVSAVSFWEIAIKVRAGKLDIGSNKPDDLPTRAIEMGMTLIPLDPHESATMGRLAENTHFDPFDRMLIWQAISRKLVLVSKDTSFQRFAADGLELLW